MRRLFFTLLLLWSVAVRAATGDIVSAATDTTGHFLDVVVEGLSTGGTYAMGLGTNSDPATAKVVLTVTSLGFDSSYARTTRTRTVVATMPVRKPYNAAYSLPYPNEETASGGNVTVRLALSQRIYRKDQAGTGYSDDYSGTNIACVIASGFYTQGGTPNNARASFTVTNNSTAEYVGAPYQWDGIAGVRTYDRVASDFVVAVNARHIFGVAAVRFDATGQTSAATATQAGSVTSTQRTASGLYYYAHTATIPVAGFTVGERIDLRCRIYPMIGDAAAVSDSDTHTTLREEARGYNKPTVVYASTVTYAYVDPNRGTDVGSAVSTNAATAATTPYWSAGKAVQGGATVIYLMAGTHPGSRNYPSAPVSATEWRVIRPAPGESASTVTLQAMGAGNNGNYWECTRIQIRDVTVQLAANEGRFDGNSQDNAIRFTNCAFDPGAFANANVPIAYRPLVAYYENCTGLSSKLALIETNTNGSGYQFDGCTWATTTSTTCNSWYRVVANSGTGGVGFGERVNVSADKPIQDNVIFAHNRFLSIDSASTVWTLGQINNISYGLVLEGNVWEKISGANFLVALCADGSTATVSNALVWHNTSAGERWNICYNDSGTVSRTRYDWSVYCNLWETLAIKTDTFGTPNANRVGNWPGLYGIGWRYNLNANLSNLGAAGSFQHEFFGLDSVVPAVSSYGSGAQQIISRSNNAVGYVQFTSRQAKVDNTPTVGSGGGTYTLGTSSPARSLVEEIVAAYDLVGNPRTSTSDAGAYAPVVSGGKYRGFFALP